MREPVGGGILITGGSGFLGRALTRRLLQLGHQRICIYSRGEHAQAQMFEDLGRPEQLRMFIGDVRDPDRLAWAVRSVEYVIHAAALKRIEVGHYNPTEMIRTNVEGTTNVLQAVANTTLCRGLVFVSSDKACQPVSPYGISKAMAESVILGGANTIAKGGPTVCAVRYGNVAGSTGSIIPRWRALRAQGVTEAPATDPECTRFWMTAAEAVELVLDALTYARSGELRTPKDMPAFRLQDLAMVMGFKTVKASGLPEWEKMHESILPGHTSDKAKRLQEHELRVLLEGVP